MSDGLITKTYSASPPWWTGDPDAIVEAVLDEGNGTTDFGEVLAGTILEKDLSTGKVRPSRLGVLTASTSSANTVTLADVANLYVGDSVRFLAPMDSASQTVVSNNSVDITFTNYDQSQKAVQIVLVDPGGTTALSTAITHSSSQLVITVTLETSSGVIQTTHAQLADEIMANAPFLSVSSATPATVCVADAGSDLTAYVKAGDNVLSARTITAINTSTKVVTLDGSAFSLDHQQFSGIYSPLLVSGSGIIDACYGALHAPIDTYDGLSRSDVEKTCQVVRGCYYRAGKLTGVEHASASAGLLENIIAGKATTPPAALFNIPMASAQLRKL